MARLNASLEVAFMYMGTSVVDGHWQIGGTNMVKTGGVAQITLKGQHTQPAEGRWAQWWSQYEHSAQGQSAQCTVGPA